MKLRSVAFTVGLCASGSATAGGLFLPGVGAQSSARAGASTAAASDGEAISLNPAGIAKSKGTVVTIGFTALNYAMSFHRNGTYDQDDEQTDPYEGQRYPVIENNPDLAIGIGQYLTIPAIGIVSDLGGAIPNLHVGAGLYTTNAYPNRNMNYVDGQPYFVANDAGGFDFPAFGSPPPPTRYDIIEQEAVIITPAIVAAYSITPQLDVGARFQTGFAHLKSSVAVWGGLANYPEQIRKDGVITLDAKDNVIPGWGLGVNYRPTPVLEIGAHYNAQMNIQGRGTAVSTNGPAVDLNGAPVVILPVDDSFARCAPGGTPQALKACVEIALPMSATLGTRYRILDDSGKERGDIELDVGWENWGTERAGEYRVVVDAKVTTETAPDQGIDLKDSIVSHGLKDTYSVRLGGSYNFDAGANTVIARGGVGYETGAARSGWERADFDGAARTTLTAGGSFRTSRVQIDAGVGVALQGTRTDDRMCNPPLASPAQGCGPGGAVNPIEDREGPDPTNPLVVPESQTESPFNQGTYKSRYLMFMLGASTWF